MMKVLILTTPAATQILNVSDVLKEEDAFDFSPYYAGWIEVFATKGKKETATSGNPR